MSPQPQPAKELTETCCPEWLLFRGIRGMLRCDQAEVVHGIARYVILQHVSLRFLSALIERTRNTPVPGAIALVGWLRSFFSVGGIEHSEGGVWIARLENERCALASLPDRCPDINWTELKFSRWPTRAAVHSLLRKSGLRRIFKLTRRLHRRQEYFKVLRVVELVACYVRYREIFQATGFRIAAASSHSNPHGIAFNLAARRCRVPTVLITHGMPVRPVARLSYDLALVHCEAARLTYLEEGCRFKHVLTHGRQQNYRPIAQEPLPEKLTVGIFLCKDVNEERLRSLVADLLGDPRISRILLRPHPKNLWRGIGKWVDSQPGSVIELSSGGTVFDDLNESDIVLGGNSSVLIDAVVAGRPAGFVAGLDYGSEDLHEMCSRGLIFAIGRDRLDPDAMLRFYRRPAWLDVLRHYANIDESESVVAQQTAKVIGKLTSAPRSVR